MPGAEGTRFGDRARSAQVVRSQRRQVRPGAILFSIKRRTCPGRGQLSLEVSLGPDRQIIGAHGCQGTAFSSGAVWHVFIREKPGRALVQLSGCCRLNQVVKDSTRFRLASTDCVSGRTPRARMRQLEDRWLPQPRVLHPWPSVRFDAIHPRQEPHAVVPLVGISAGGIG